MTRLLPIAASLALVIAASATAQDAAAPATDPAAAQDAAAPAIEPAAAGPVAAEAAPATPAPAASTGDATRGKSLTYTCRGCHGVTGYKNAYPNYHVPKLGGQSAVYLGIALNEYREGKRKHPTMQAQAESFSEEDIADIAAYLSSIK
jgi:cytochrome c553